MQNRTANVRRDGLETSPDSLSANPEPDPIGAALNDNVRTHSLVSGLLLLALLVLANAALLDLHPASCPAGHRESGPSIGDTVKLAGC